MASLSSLLEDWKNYRKNIEWQLGRGEDIANQNDVAAIEDWERWQGVGPADIRGLSGLAGAIKGSHGSPYAFNKFDFSKIGTGEGKQKYGVGGYFAKGFDNPVAGAYRTTEPLETETDLLKTIAGEKGGHLYNVELRWPDPKIEASNPLSEEHLLHWNKPLSQQSEYVLEKLGMHNKPINLDEAPVGYGPEVKEFEKFLNAKVGGELIPDVVGSKFYNELTYSPQAASEYLNRKGIPGIKYTEGYNGPNAELGSNSYVIFDENIPKIVSRNGISLADLLRRK